jgi:two-component system sensor histidine kinase QseC
MSPLPDSGIPAEIRPLTRAINELLQQLRNTFERERRFTADAAHELRTPLASIKTQAQVAQRATDEEQRQQALKQINAGVDRATRLVEQLLTLARLDPANAVVEFKPVNLCQLLAAVIADIAPAAHAKEIDIGMTECQLSTISGNEAALAILMRNLLDNAIRYTPAGGTVDAALMMEPQRLIFTITDSGPGVPEAERSRVLERFYRGEMEDKVPGCGLGLSIVKRVVELHGATLMLDQPASGVGLRVTVAFPI